MGRVEGVKKGEKRVMKVREVKKEIIGDANVEKKEEAEKVLLASTSLKVTAVVFIIMIKWTQGMSMGMTADIMTEVNSQKVIDLPDKRKEVGLAAQIRRAVLEEVENRVQTEARVTAP